MTPLPVLTAAIPALGSAATPGTSIQGPACQPVPSKWLRHTAPSALTTNASIVSPSVTAAIRALGAHMTPSTTPHPRHGLLAKVTVTPSGDTGPTTRLIGAAFALIDAPVVAA